MAQEIHATMSAEEQTMTDLYNGTNCFPSWWLAEHPLESIRAHLGNQLAYLNKQCKEKYRVLLSAQIKVAAVARE
jgi:hypothetical protein